MNTMLAKQFWKLQMNKMLKKGGHHLLASASRLVCCLYVVVLAGHLPGAAQESIPVPSGPKTQFDQPTLSILKPVQGQTFGKESIVVDIAVDNFELVLPDPRYGGPTKKPAGHLHIYLDSNPLIATSSRRVMIGSNTDGELMPGGWHRLLVELVDEDHNVLEPRLYKQVQFYTSYGRDRHADDSVDGASASGFVK